MERRSSVLKVALLLIALSAVSFTAGALAKSAPKRVDSSEEVYKQLNPYVDALTLIQEKYVDEDKIQAKKLIEGSMQGMVATLDPFSQYMGADDFKEMQTETSGEFGGLGIEITAKDDRLTVITPIDGTPADKAGVRASDIIVRINKDTLSRSQPVRHFRRDMNNITGREFLGYSSVDGFATNLAGSRVHRVHDDAAHRQQGLARCDYKQIGHGVVSFRRSGAFQAFENYGVVSPILHAIHALLVFVELKRIGTGLQLG